MVTAYMHHQMECGTRQLSGYVHCLLVHNKHIHTPSSSSKQELLGLYFLAGPSHGDMVIYQMFT